jgi:hypothetical protein
MNDKYKINISQDYFIRFLFRMNILLKNSKDGEILINLSKDMFMKTLIDLD